jgi:long-chain acyl-CoA synthetase
MAVLSCNHFQVELGFLEQFADRPLALDDTGGILDARTVEPLVGDLAWHVPARSLVLLLAENTVGALAGYLACLQRRAVPLLLGASTDRDFVGRLLENYEVPYVWLPTAQAAEMEGERLMEALGYCLVGRAVEGPAVHPDLSLLLPTSGSTGSPKLVRHSYANLCSSARNVARFFELQADDRPVAGLPLYFTMGLSVVTSHLYVGATVLLTRSSVTEPSFWSFVKSQRATSFTGVPYSFEMLHRLRFNRMDLPDLRVLSQGGGKLREPVFRAFAEHARESGRQFYATYGQTEGTARMSYLAPEYACERIGSIGRAIPEGRLSLIDEAGFEQTSPEATGELAYTGPNVTLGYAFERADLVKGDERGGVLHTGDLARRDADGFYYITGRKNRFLKLYGLRISLDEIEQIVKRAFATECVAGGDDTKLIVAIDTPDIAPAVKTEITDKTGLYHGSVDVQYVEAFRRNDAGKIIYQF